MGRAIGLIVVVFLAASAVSQLYVASALRQLIETIAELSATVDQGLRRSEQERQSPAPE